MKLATVSNAPEVFSAPLISAEKSVLFEKISSAVSRALQWIRSLFSFIFPRKEKTKPPLPKRDVHLAQRALAALDQEKPSPIRFVKNSISQGVIAYGISWLQPNAFTTFIAKRAVDATSASVVFVSDAFFPAYSNEVKQGFALTICAPAVWIAADRLGYRQGYLFFLGVGINVCKLGSQVFSHYQARWQREAQRTALTQATA